jgi:hypothetical protein
MVEPMLGVGDEPMPRWIAAPALIGSMRAR